jgi:predicted aspartyl protease
MTRRFPYDRTRSPAAPVLPVTFGRAGAPARAAAMALVDSGAELSVMPERLARSLRLPVLGEVTVMGVAGSRRARIYGAELEIDGLSLAIEVAGVGTQTLLGRDVLNRWTLVLRGREGELELVTDSERRG